MSEMIRMDDEYGVLVIADNALARAGLASLLADDPAWHILGQVSIAAAADDLALYAPDILLVDTGWQMNNVHDSIRGLVDSGVPLLVLVTDDTDAPTLIGTLATGDSYGVLLNDRTGDDLTLALHSILAGMVILDPALAASLTPSIAMDADIPADDLTPRENDVLQRLAQGVTNKAIAQDLGITEHTVKFHVNAIMTKLNAQSRTDAVVRATRAGLIIL